MMRAAAKGVRRVFLLLLLGQALFFSATARALSSSAAEQRRHRQDPAPTSPPGFVSDGTAEAQEAATEAASQKASAVVVAEEQAAKANAAQVTVQAKQTVDSIGEHEEALAVPMAQAATHDKAAAVEAKIDQEFQQAKVEAEGETKQALESMAGNANTKAKALAANRLDSAKKDAEVEAEDVHMSSEQLEEAMRTSAQTAEQAAHFAVNAAHKAVNTVGTIPEWSPQTAMKQAQESATEVNLASEELAKARLVAKLSSGKGADDKLHAADAKTESQRAMMDADAALKQTEKGKALVEAIRREVMDAKIKSSGALQEARNAVFKAQDAAKKAAKASGGGAAAAAALVSRRSSLRAKKAFVKVKAVGGPKETFGEGTHDEEFGHEYTPVDGPKNLKEPNPAEDKAWNREMHRNLMNYDGHGDYIKDGRTPRSGAGRVSGCASIVLAAVVGRLLLL